MAPISSATVFERGASVSPTSAHTRLISPPIWILPNSARANRPRQNQTMTGFHSGSMDASALVCDAHLRRPRLAPTGPRDEQVLDDQRLEPADALRHHLLESLGPRTVRGGEHFRCRPIQSR